MRNDFKGFSKNLKIKTEKIAKVLIFVVIGGIIMMYIYFWEVEIMADRGAEKNKFKDIIVAFLSVVFLVVFNSSIGYFFRGFFEGGSILSATTDVFLTIFSLVFPLVLLNVFSSKNEKKSYSSEEFSWRELLKSSVFVLGLGFLFRISYSFFIAFLAFSHPSDISEKGFFVLFLYFVSSVIIPSVFEEVLFRDKLFRIFERYGLPFLTVPLLFAFSHSGIHSVINAFVFGVLLQFIYQKNRRLEYCIIIHFINNLIAYLAAVAKDGGILSTVTIIVPYIFVFVFLCCGVAVIIGRKRKNEQ